MKIRTVHIVFITLFAFPLLYLIIQRSIHPRKEKAKVSETSGAPQTTIPDILEMAKKNALANPCYDTYLELGLQYYNHKQFQESILATEKAIEFNPNSYIAYNNLCAAYNELRLWTKAIEACQKSLLLSPDFQLAKNNLNWAVREKEKNEK